MTKYKEYVNKMLADNKDLFDKFKVIHDQYALNPEIWQKRYNEEGEAVLEVVHEYENRLCANTERGMYNKFSAGLAEKFQNEVRKIFPQIDRIGIKVSTTIVPENKNNPEAFEFKKLL